MRNLKAGEPIELPDGSVLRPEDYVGPSTQRRVALLSDMRGIHPGTDPSWEAAKYWCPRTCGLGWHCTAPTFAFDAGSGVFTDLVALPGGGVVRS